MPPLSWFKKFALSAIITFVVVDFVILNVLIANLTAEEDQPAVSKVRTLPPSPTLISPNNSKSETTAATTDIDSKIYPLITQIAQINKTLSITKSPSLPTITPAQSTQLPTREYYVPLGSATTTSTNWTDIKGVEANIVPANYGTITGVYFEAGLEIPTGNGQVYARLNNVTDSTTLIESEVTKEGSGGVLVSSGAIPIPATTKLYRVQLRSTQGAEAKLLNARIKIFAR